MPNYAALVHQVADLCRETGEWIDEQAQIFNREKVEYKGRNDLVSYVDKEAEKRLLQGLRHLMPKALFLSEETNAQTQVAQGAYWIVDPLDGTTNFVHAVPIYAISVALMVNGELKIGVVYEINRRECFYAWEKGGAYLNHTPLRCNNSTPLEASLIATGYPYYDFGLTAYYLQILERFMKKTHGVRRLGAASVDLAYVAAGRFEGFFEYNLQPWDVAAGALIVKEAGGSLCEFTGGTDYIFGRSIVAARHSGLLHEMLEQISPIWEEALNSQSKV
ncbi:myo-inositol-1(or 4)-monophosphatase [Thermonema lapsum]|uniref:Inositol-1-monophosphatase n=1 Tax=Thermonema lapsum TaxID=28195 RepID=A0A846MS85_9BACT|nr:inositol monophosphatase family protein [Thermonema lapsum]NIK74464.1 myo-inositol-1(or 4)-monophosphatase [Thermonema lapsum]